MENRKIIVVRAITLTVCSFAVEYYWLFMFSLLSMCQSIHVHVSIITTCTWYQTTGSSQLADGWLSIFMMYSNLLACGKRAFLGSAKQCYRLPSWLKRENGQLRTTSSCAQASSTATS